LLNILDIIIIAIIALSGIIGFFRGFVREIMSLIGWVVSAWLAWHYAGMLAPSFESLLGSPDVRKAAAFVCIFLVALVLFALLSYLISKVMSKSALKGTDRTLGLLFGVLRGAVIIAVLALLVNSTQFATDSWWTESVLKEFFLLFAYHGLSLLPAEVSEFFGQKV
jgi:membrane protein required for colicin V production